jgi:cytoskeletal protein RodZ
LASVGEELRKERLRQGKQVSEVAAAIKIRPELLEAIEEGHFDRLPGGSYRRGFVRQYARALGLNEESTVASFLEEYLDLPVALPAPMPKRPSQGLRLAGALAALAAAAFLYLAATNYTTISESHIARDNRRHAAVAEAPHHEASHTRLAAQGEAARSDPAAGEPASSGVVSSGLTSGVQSGESGRPVRVELNVTERVWVSVKCDGEVAFTGTLEGGQIKRFEASSQMTVLVGNAGGLAVELNEKPVGPLGAHGEIQMVEFTPGGVGGCLGNPPHGPARKKTLRCKRRGGTSPGLR